MQQAQSDALTESLRVWMAFAASSVVGDAVRLKARRMVLRHRKGVLSFQNRVGNVSNPQHRGQQTPNYNYGLPRNENQHESTSGD
jgi:hypothetical protein